jgi:hypothetical protein
MVFSDPSGHNGVIQRAYFLCFGDSLDHSNDYALIDVTASANQWLYQVACAIWRSSKLWEWDDANQTTLSEAQTDLVFGQSDYSLPTSILHVMSASILDVGGNWQLLDQIDPMEIQKDTGVDFDYYQSVPGFPSEYALYDNSVLLKPAPDNGVSVTLAGGLKLFVSRVCTTFSAPANYAVADATIPGFDASFHDILSYGIAADYLIANGQDKKGDSYIKKIWTFDGSGKLNGGLMKNMAMAYGTRNEDKPDVVGPHRESYD